MGRKFFFENHTQETPEQFRRLGQFQAEQVVRVRREQERGNIFHCQHNNSYPLRSVQYRAFSRHFSNVDLY